MAGYLECIPAATIGNYNQNLERDEPNRQTIPALDSARCAVRAKAHGIALFAAHVHLRVLAASPRCALALALYPLPTRQNRLAWFGSVAPTEDA